MALLRVRAVLDPSPQVVTQTFDEQLRLSSHVCSQLESSATVPALSVQGQLNLASFASASVSVSATVPESNLREQLQLSSSVCYQLESSVPELDLQDKLSLASFASANSETPAANLFLVVQSEADFDLIVDEIWANMKKKNKGWKTKAQLRAGLLTFMQSLPGN